MFGEAEGETGRRRMPGDRGVRGRSQVPRCYRRLLLLLLLLLQLLLLLPAAPSSSDRTCGGGCRRDSSAYTKPFSVCIALLTVPLAVQAISTESLFDIVGYIGPIPRWQTTVNRANHFTLRLQYRRIGHLMPARVSRCIQDSRDQIIGSSQKRDVMQRVFMRGGGQSSAQCRKCLGSMTLK